MSADGSCLPAAELEAVVERHIAARIKQGLAPTIKDPRALDKAAALFTLPPK